MPIILMFITNDPVIAQIAEKSGVDRVWVDLETKGKEQRQKNMNTVKSRHSLSDVVKLSQVVEKSELMVRINPWDEESVQEVEDVIRAGASRIMLPMWKTVEEVGAFLSTVNGRVKTTLLLETKEAVECLDEVLENPLVEEIHIGLNDLHLSYGLNFMFEILSNGLVEKLCIKMALRGIPYGFGGIACIGEGLLPAERIMREHCRLNSSLVILSRSFCDVTACRMSMEELECFFMNNVKKLRECEVQARKLSQNELEANRQAVSEIVRQIVQKKGER